jgi:hypothetical protein
VNKVRTQVDKVAVFGANGDIPRWCLHQNRAGNILLSRIQMRPRVGDSRLEYILARTGSNMPL